MELLELGFGNFFTILQLATSDPAHINSVIKSIEKNGTCLMGHIEANIEVRVHNSLPYFAEASDRLFETYSLIL